MVAQRLARTLCDCKEEEEIGVEALKRNGFTRETEPLKAFKPVGCVRCARSGYKGRIGVYEVMQVTDEMRELIVEKRPADAIAEIAVAQGMRRLRDDGLDKVRQGLTSMAEALRILGGSA